MKRNLTNFK